MLAARKHTHHDAYMHAVQRGQGGREPAERVSCREQEEERTGTGGGMNLNPSTSMVGDADGGCGCAGVIEDGGEPGDPMSFLDDPFPAVNATAQ